MKPQVHILEGQSQLALFLKPSHQNQEGISYHLVLLVEN